MNARKAIVFSDGIAQLTRPTNLRLERLLAVAACVTATAAWAIYSRDGLILSHYDAKAHLVVARRVFDNITPGWQQFGAVWLPLPHLINVLPAQIDLFYRTGLFASLVSVLCLGLSVWAVARLVVAITGSRAGATVAALLLAWNPNLLYLYTTPMTEPLLLAALFLCVLWLYEWVQDDVDTVPVRLGLALFAATWTRYEAWPVLAMALVTACSAVWRRTGSPGTTWRRAWRLCIWPAAAAVIFIVNSRITIGEWFVTAGFYVPDPTYQRQLQRTILGIWWGTHQLSGYVIESIALAAAAFAGVRACARRADASLLVPIAVWATAALPFYAFYSGHPYRIRYMIPMAAACALWCGIAIGRASDRRLRTALVVALLASVAVEAPLWKAHPAMLEEAQWDVPASLGRHSVTACLTREYRGDKILASMGSLAHYMQELSNNGLQVADFVNEGNGIIWEAALESGPAEHAGWMLVEEEAEGGDVLAQRLRTDAAFARGMERVCEGGGVALYKRVNVRNARLQ
jgi:hypothetical protein